MPQSSPSADAPLFIVLNAGSGSSDAERTRETIESVLSGVGRAHRILYVEDARRLHTVAWQAVQEARIQKGIVVAAGGDGTNKAVAQVVVGRGGAFGVLPPGPINYL